MALKWKEISLLLDEARPLLEGSTLQKIAQLKDVANGESFIFQGFGDSGPWRLWVCLLQDHAAWVLADLNWQMDAQPEPSTFIMVLRKRLLGQRIMRLEQIPNERMIVMHFESGLVLLFELLPRKANLLLGEEWDPYARELRCIHSFRQVSLETGAIYQAPPPPKNIAAEEVRPFDGYKAGDSLHEAVRDYYWGLVHQSGFSAFKSQWKRAWKSQNKKVVTALENAKGDLDEARESELFQKRGITLVSHLYELGPKAFPVSKKLVLDDVEIPLDLTKTFSENAENYFRKAKKMLRATDELADRVGELQSKMDDLKMLGEALEKAPDEESLRNLEKNFKRLEIPIPDRNIGSDKKDADTAKPFLAVESSDGFLIFCGRNQEENRRVTFQEAKGNDLWMHVKGMPGAHVVIKGMRNKTIPLSTLLEAAQLCLYHSKIRKGKKAEVDYTQRKHVRAIKGTFAEVTYTGNKTIFLEADPEALKKLMKSG